MGFGSVRFERVQSKNVAQDVKEGRYAAVRDDRIETETNGLNIISIPFTSGFPSRPIKKEEEARTTSQRAK